MNAASHSKFPPSHMDRVLACPGSFALAATCPPRETKYTDEGSAAHQLAQLALTDGDFDARAYLGETITLYERKGTPQETRSDFKVTEEMCRHVQTYVDSVRGRVEKYKSDSNVKKVTLHVEKRIDTSAVMGVPKQSGIADTLIVVEYKDNSILISVEDLKYGKGVKVSVENNVQLMTYGVGALDAYGRNVNVRQVDLVIHMPRLGYVGRDTVTAKQLRAFSKKLKGGVAAAQQQEKIFKIQGVGAITLNPGDKQCRFCPAKGICPAFNLAAKKKKDAMPAKKPPIKKKRAAP